MEVVRTGIRDVTVVVPRVFEDDRGFFLESWNEDRFRASVADVKFIQDNHSRSRGQVVRGLHYQLEKPQGKLVRVVRGVIFDVAVDLRREEPTFGKWVGEELSDNNHKQLWIPEGFAHGFMVLSDVADVLYRCTGPYHPQSERTLAWNDPDVNIQWPKGGDPILSQKDQLGVALRDADVFS